MISYAVESWEKNKQKIKKYFQNKHPENYKEIVKIVIDNIALSESDDNYGEFNPSKEIIHEIDDSVYSGRLLFIIPENSYEPNDYYCVSVYYGSCDSCDMLEEIKNSHVSSSQKKPTRQQVSDYMTLALHIVQQIKKI